MTRRISLVEVCWSLATTSARLRLSTSVFRCAYDAVVGSTPLKGPPQSSQNLAVGRFSCWHRGHVIPEPPHRQADSAAERWTESSYAAIHRSSVPSGLGNSSLRAYLVARAPAVDPRLQGKRAGGAGQRGIVPSYAADDIVDRLAVPLGAARVLRAPARAHAGRTR